MTSEISPNFIRHPVRRCALLKVASLVMEPTAESMEAMATIIGRVADLGPMSNTTLRWAWGIRNPGADKLRQRGCKGRSRDPAEQNHRFLVRLQCFCAASQDISMLMVHSFSCIVHCSFISFDFLTQERPHGHLFARADSQQRDGDERIQWSTCGYVDPEQKTKWMGANRLAAWESYWAMLGICWHSEWNLRFVRRTNSCI